MVSAQITVQASRLFSIVAVNIGVTVRRYSIVREALKPELGASIQKEIRAWGAGATGASRLISQGKER